MYEKSAMKFLVKTYMPYVLPCLIGLIMGIVLPSGTGKDLIFYMVALAMVAIIWNFLVINLRAILRVRKMSRSMIDKIVNRDFMKLNSEVLRKLEKDKPIDDQVKDLLEYCTVCLANPNYTVKQIESKIAISFGKDEVSLEYADTYVDNQKITAIGDLSLTVHGVTKTMVMYI